ITRPPPIPTLFPYTTLFRSISVGSDQVQAERGDQLAANVDGRHAASGLVLLETGPPLSAAVAANARSAGGAVDPLCQASDWWTRSEEHTSELQSQSNLVCRL